MRVQKLGEQIVLFMDEQHHHENVVILLTVDEQEALKENVSRVLRQVNQRFEQVVLRIGKAPWPSALSYAKIDVGML